MHSDPAPLGRFLRQFLAPLLLFCGILATTTQPCAAQELEPGAYSPSPVDVNILVTGFAYNWGDLSFDPTGPITDSSANIHTIVLGYVRTVDVAGRAASIGLIVPYVFGDVRGNYLNQFVEVSRSNFADVKLRFAINLHGVPAMSAQEFAGYQQTGWNIGTSLTVSAPFGEYSSDKLINIGTNRWGFKPEIGITRRLGRWSLELYSGIWFFTDNTDFYGGQTRSQEPIGSVQFHAIYTIRPRMWIAYDVNYYTGGRTSFGTGKNQDLMRNSRMGLTFAMPINRQQSVKVTYSRGAYTTIGADFHSLVASWQYVWGGR
jgi:hypothetical protein